MFKKIVRVLFVLAFLCMITVPLLATNREENKISVDENRRLEACESKLLDFENNRKQLIEIIKSVFTETDLKLPTLGKDDNIIDIVFLFILINIYFHFSNEINGLFLSLLQRRRGTTAVVDEVTPYHKQTSDGITKSLF